MLGSWNWGFRPRATAHQYFRCIKLDLVWWGGGYGFLKPEHYLHSVVLPFCQETDALTLALTVGGSFYLSIWFPRCWGWLKKEKLSTMMISPTEANPLQLGWDITSKRHDCGMVYFLLETTSTVTHRKGQYGRRTREWSQGDDVLSKISQQDAEGTAGVPWAWII